MLDIASKHARDCYARAADCRRRADAAVDADARAYWREQEARWLERAEREDLSTQVATFVEDDAGVVDDDTAPAFSPEAEDGVATLVRVFNRACLALSLDLSDETLPRKIARTIIHAAIDGESDPEKLYQRALKAVSN